MVDRADERRHDPGSAAGWEESFSFDFAAADGSLGGYVRLAVRQGDGRAWYWAALVERGSPVVLVRDHDVELPPGRSLEVRASGLWADMTCETPLEHWTVGLEAFGVSLDDPAEAFGAERGDPMALGLDLEWEATAAADSVLGPDARLRPAVRRPRRSARRLAPHRPLGRGMEVARVGCSRLVARNGVDMGDRAPRRRHAVRRRRPRRGSRRRRPRAGPRALTVGAVEIRANPLTTLRSPSPDRTGGSPGWTERSAGTTPATAGVVQAGQTGWPGPVQLLNCTNYTENYWNGVYRNRFPGFETEVS